MVRILRKTRRSRCTGLLQKLRPIHLDESARIFQGHRHSQGVPEEVRRVVRGALRDRVQQTQAGRGREGGQRGVEALGGAERLQFGGRRREPQDAPQAVLQEVRVERLRSGEAIAVCFCTLRNC